MQCTKPIMLPDMGMYVPCGTCEHCRRQRAIEWKTRLWHEADYHEDSVFVTLTYDEERLPESGDLDKSGAQRWLKRLRRRLEPRRIKYYLVGEYGEKNGRPHYHAIVFGMSTCGNCWTCRGPGNWADTPKGDCEVLRDSWDLGFVRSGTVTPASVGYVAGYIEKALYTPELKSRIRPFSLMSQGLGRDFVRENRLQLIAMVGCTVNGKEVGLPKYYRKKLPELTAEDLLVAGAERRQKARDHYFSKYGEHLSNVKVNKAVRDHRAQAERNLRAELKLRERDVEK